MSRPLRLAVVLVPNARKSEVVGEFDGAIKIRLQAQPMEGQANEALVRLLATMLGLPRSAIRITHGHSSRRKLLEISGLGADANTDADTDADTGAAVLGRISALAGRSATFEPNALSSI